MMHGPHCEEHDTQELDLTPEAERNGHMCAMMAQFMARILETRPGLFVRSHKLLSWTGADAPVHDPDRPHCRSCGQATHKRRVLCEACRRNPMVVYGAPLIETMYRSSNPLYAMNEEKRRVIIFLKQEQQLVDDALSLAQTLGSWAYAVWVRQNHGGEGNVYFSRELVHGGGSYARESKCGLARQVRYGGLGVKLHEKLKQSAVEWLLAVDAHVRDHFDIPLGRACTGDASFTTCVDNLATLIANRVALFEDPCNKDPSQILSSRGCEHLARLQHLRCEFYAQNAIVADIEGMRALARLAREGALPDDQGPLLRVLQKPPPELLNLVPSVVIDMDFAELRNTLGRGDEPRKLANWRASVQPESLCVLLDRAIAAAQAWKPPITGFLKTVRFDARSVVKNHLPSMPWISGKSGACWALVPRKLHEHRRVGLDPTGERIVLMCSALMQIDAQQEPEFFVPGIVRCDIVFCVAQRQINLAAFANAYLREQLRPYTAGLEWDTSRHELLNWNGSHLEDDVRRAARLLSGYTLQELRKRFLSPEGPRLLLQPAMDHLVVKPQQGYETWCETSLEFLLPILQEYRESLGCADNVATHPDGEVLRMLPQVRAWKPENGALTITAGQARAVPPVKALLQRMEREGWVRRKRQGTKVLWVLELGELIRMLC